MSWRNGRGGAYSARGDPIDELPSFSYKSVKKPSQLDTPSETSNQTVGGVSSFTASQLPRTGERVRHGRYRSSQAVTVNVSASVEAAVEGGNAGAKERSSVTRNAMSELIAPRQKKFPYQTTSMKSRSSSFVVEAPTLTATADSRAKRWVPLDDNDEDAIDALMLEMDAIEAQQALSQTPANSTLSGVPVQSFKDSIRSSRAGEASPAPSLTVAQTELDRLRSQLESKEAELSLLRDQLKHRQDKEIKLQKQLIEKKQEMTAQKKIASEETENAMEQLRTKLKFKEEELRDNGAKMDTLEKQVQEERSQSATLRIKLRNAEKALASAAAATAAAAAKSKAMESICAQSVIADSESTRRGYASSIEERRVTEMRRKLNVWDVTTRNSRSGGCGPSCREALLQSLSEPDSSLVTLLNTMSACDVSAQESTRNAQLMVTNSQSLCCTRKTALESSSNPPGRTVLSLAKNTNAQTIPSRESSVCGHRSIRTELVGVIRGIADESEPCRNILPVLQLILLNSNRSAEKSAMQVLHTFVDMCEDCRTCVLDPATLTEAQTSYEEPSSDIDLHLHPSFTSPRIRTTISCEYGSPDQSNGKRTATAREGHNKRQRSYPTARPVLYILDHLQRHLKYSPRNSEMLPIALALLRTLAWACPVDRLAAKFPLILTDETLATLLMKGSVHVQESALDLVFRLLHSEECLRSVGKDRDDEAQHKSVADGIVHLLNRQIPLIIGAKIIAVLSLVVTNCMSANLSLFQRSQYESLFQGVVVLLDRATSVTWECGRAVTMAALQLLVLFCTEGKCNIRCRRDMILCALKRIDSNPHAMEAHAFTRQLGQML